MNIRYCIIEDETKAQQALQKMISIIDPAMQCVALATNVQDALHIMENETFEIAFLDIKLQNGTAFDILSQTSNLNFHLIFTTAYNEYAIKAFKYSALDYLLKPIDPNELSQALTKAREMINKRLDYQKLLEILNHNQLQSDKKIVLHTQQQTYIFSENDIMALEADGAYTKFYTLNKTVMVSKNLKHYEDLLPSEQFIRPHKSYLVNKKYVTGMKDNCLELKTGLQVPISSRKKAEIHHIFKS